MAIPHFKTLFHSVKQWVHEFFVRPEFDAQTSDSVSDQRLSAYPEEEAKRIREYLDRLEETEAIGLDNYVAMMRDPVTDRYWDRRVIQQGHGMWNDYYAVKDSVADIRLGDPEELERFKREGFQQIVIRDKDRKLHYSPSHERFYDFLNGLEETEAKCPAHNVGVMREPATNSYWAYKKTRNGDSTGYEYEAFDTSEAESLLGDPEKLALYQREGTQRFKFEGEEEERGREIANRLVETEAMSAENHVGIMRDPVSDRYWIRKKVTWRQGLSYEYEAIETSEVENILGDPVELERYRREGIREIQFAQLNPTPCDEFWDRLEETPAVCTEFKACLMRDPVMNQYWTVEKTKIPHGMRYNNSAVEHSVAEKILSSPEELERYRREGLREISVVEPSKEAFYSDTETPEARKERIERGRELANRLIGTEAISLDKQFGILRDPVTNRYWKLTKAKKSHCMCYLYWVLDDSVAENILGDTDELERFKREGFRQLKFKGEDEEYGHEIANRLIETKAMSPENHVGIMHDPETNQYWVLKKEQQSYSTTYKYEAIETSEVEKILGDPDELERYKREGIRRIWFKEEVKPARSDKVTNWFEEDAKRFYEMWHRLEETVAVSPCNHVGLMSDPVTDQFWTFKKVKVPFGVSYKCEAVENSVAESLLGDPEKLEVYRREGRWTD